MKRVAVVLGLLVAVVAAAGGAAYLAKQLEPAEPGSSEQVAFTVERGTGLRQIADALEAGGIIRNADAAVLVARLRDWGSCASEAVPPLVAHILLQIGPTVRRNRMSGSAGLIERE